MHMPCRPSCRIKLLMTTLFSRGRLAPISIKHYLINNDGDFHGALIKIRWLNFNYILVLRYYLLPPNNYSLLLGLMELAMRFRRKIER